MSQPRAYTTVSVHHLMLIVLGLPDSGIGKTTKITSGTNFWKIGHGFVTRKIRWVLMSIAVFWLAVFYSKRNEFLVWGAISRWQCRGCWHTWRDACQVDRNVLFVSERCPKIWIPGMHPVPRLNSISLVFLVGRFTLVAGKGKLYFRRIDRCSTYDHLSLRLHQKFMLQLLSHQGSCVPCGHIWRWVSHWSWLPLG